MNTQNKSKEYCVAMERFIAAYLKIINAKSYKDVILSDSVKSNDKCEKYYVDFKWQPKK